MNNIYKKLKKAFSLLELSICILIVSVIIVVCVPIVTNQLKKTDEYSYFLAFKTVETLGSQIVALGDPDVSGGSWNLKNRKSYVDDNINTSRYIANRIDEFTRKHSQKANAQRTTLLSWPSYEYDMARLCNHNVNVIIDYLYLAGNILKPEDLGANPEALDQWYAENCSLYNSESRIKKRFGCNNPYTGNSTGITLLDFQNSTFFAKEFCEQVIGPECLTLYNGYNVQYEYKNITLNQALNIPGSNVPIYGQCIVYLDDEEDTQTGASGVATLDDDFLDVANTACSGLGYFNMGGTLQAGCSQCTGTLSFPAVNHPNVCCPAPETGKVQYSYIDDEGAIQCTSCIVGAFNEQTNECCPDNSYYSRTIGHCACQQGFVSQVNAQTGQTECNAVNSTNFRCPGGYHAAQNGTDNICVVNPPIIRAGRFCELIAANYNISSSNCTTFSAVTEGGDTVYYNAALYNAITANTTPYLSAKSIEGAFNNLTPNIVFSNGLKLWILGDKAASIAGLSFDPTSYTPNINACVEHDTVYTKDACDTLASGDTNKVAYFCPGSNNCFTLNSGTSTTKLSDARSCCPTVDYDDLIPLYPANLYLTEPRVYAINGFTVFVDITGDKDITQGGGTLWKDVFPFYVSADGSVYPGYPLNGKKTFSGLGNEGILGVYQGGNSSMLNSDVYYYDIIEDGDNTVRKKVMAYNSIPYSRALCFSLKVSAFTPYCQNLGQNFRGGGTYSKLDQYIYSNDNPCWKHRCYIHVKNKIKYL